MEKEGTGFVEYICIGILFLLSLLNCVVDVYGNIQYYSGITSTLAIAASVVAYVFVFYYIIYGYKKPHGNLMKYIFLLYAFRIAINIVDVFTTESSDIISNPLVTNIEVGVIRFVSAVLIVYVSTRLGNLKKNVPVMLVITFSLLLLSSIYYSNYSTIMINEFLTIIWDYGVFIQWMDIVFAYLFRFNKHKEAGLSDEERAELEEKRKAAEELY